MAHVLEAVVRSLEEDRVVLLFSDGQTLTVPRDACEGTLTTGASVRCVFAVPGAEDAARQRLAQDILNELLRP